MKKVLDQVKLDENSLITAVINVEQKDGTCHKGYRSCFYRKISKNKLEKIFDKCFDHDAAKKNNKYFI